MEGQRPAAWRVVFKGLTLLEHLIKNGSERCVDDARNHGHSLRALQQFNYYEGTIDRGQGVREKSKQLIEMLSDDERVREERMKARKLREKFGQNKSVASSSMSRGGYGYGNDSGWDSGGGGYGEGGIDSKRSSRKSDDDRYAGRYDNDRDTRQTSSAAPTFASLPPAEKKKKKKKKKPVDDEAPAPAAPAVDLLDFGAEAPASAPTATDDDFGDLRSGMANVSVSDDPFATPAPAAQSAPQDDFGNFGGAQAAPASSGGDFGDFGSAPTPAPAADPFAAPMAGNMNAFGGQQQQQPMMGAPAMGAPAMGAPMGNGMGQPQGMMAAPAPAQNNDDDFGDFADADKGPKERKPAVSSDPLSNLISLDGLSKNNSKNDKSAKLNQPVLANTAAANYQSEKSTIDNSMKQGMQSANIGGGMDSFSGLGNMGGPGNMTMQQPQTNSMGQGMNGGMQGQGFMQNNMMGMGGMQGMQGQGIGMQNNMMGMGGMQGQGMGMQGGMMQGQSSGMGMQAQGMNGGFQNNMMQQPQMGQMGQAGFQGGAPMGGFQGNMGGGAPMQNNMGMGQNTNGMNNNMNNFSGFQ